MQIRCVIKKGAFFKGTFFIFGILLILLKGFCWAGELKFILNSALKRKLYKKPEWQILLHYNPTKHKFLIKDPKFLLSNTNPSPKRELIKTIESFFSLPETYKDPNEHPICKFPARKRFLEHFLKIRIDPYPELRCSELEEYVKKAPVNKIYLVFASENLRSPSSIMGHIFLKLEGFSKKGKLSIHAVSFVTVIDTYNLFELAVKSTIIGMKGIFSLKPYRKVLYKYLIEEDRNIWEFPITIDEFHKELIHLHIWELKDVKSKYFFQSYNCATVVFYILCLANPKMIYQEKTWLSPKDIIKLSYKNGIITKGKLIPSERWFIKMLIDELNFKRAIYIKKLVENSSNILTLNRDNLDIKECLLAKTYSTYLFRKGKISKQKWKIFQNIKIKDAIIDITQYKNPLRTHAKSQFTLGYTKTKKNDYVNFVISPISNSVYDNNLNYFSENELKILSFDFILKENQLSIKRIILYQAANYIPYDLLTKPLSWKFSLEVNKRKFHKYLSTCTISGGIGLTLDPYKRIYFFFLPFAELGFNLKKSYISPNPQLGFMIYEPFNMKTTIFYKYWLNPTSKSVIEATHSIFVSKNLTALIKFNSNVNGHLKDIFIGLKYHF